MTQTKTRKYGWGKLRLTCDMTEANSPITFGYADGGGTPHKTPFQVADARRNWDNAFRLVNNWLTFLGPSGQADPREPRMGGGER